MSSDFIFTTPQDQGGSTQRVDGTKWNYHINRVTRSIPIFAVVYKDGTTTYAYQNTGATIASDTASRTVINSALSAANNAGGGAVLIRAGTYDMGGSGATFAGMNKIWVLGEGIDVTILQNGGFIKNDGTATNNCRFSDMTIDANNSAVSCMNIGTNSTDFVLERLKMKNSSTNFLLNWSTVDHLLVDKCIFMDGGLSGSADNCAGSQVKTTENMTIWRDCYFSKTNSLGGAMLTTGATGNLLVDGCQMYDASNLSYAAVSIENSFGSCKEIRIANCKSYGQNMGFQIGNSSTAGKEIDRAEIAGCTSTALQKTMGAKEAIISDGMIKNSIYGFFMTNNVSAKLSNCIAKNTNFYSSGTTSDKGGFYGASNTRLQIDSLDVFDDQGTGTTPHGIRLSPTAGTSQYINNCTLIGPFTVSPLHVTSATLLKVTGGEIVGTPSFTTNTVQEIRNLKGYNPQGAASITVTASPFTYTAGSTPEAVYIRGGTVSDVSKNSTTIFTASPCSVFLEPNESVVVTYSSAPTMVKDRK